MLTLKYSRITAEWKCRGCYCQAPGNYYEAGDGDEDEDEEETRARGVQLIAATAAKPVDAWENYPDADSDWWCMCCHTRFERPKSTVALLGCEDCEFVVCEQCYEPCTRTAPAAARRLELRRRWNRLSSGTAYSLEKQPSSSPSGVGVGVALPSLELTTGFVAKVKSGGNKSVDFSGMAGILKVLHARRSAQASDQFRLGLSDGEGEISSVLASQHSKVGRQVPTLVHVSRACAAAAPAPPRDSFVRSFVRSFAAFA